MMIKVVDIRFSQVGKIPPFVLRHVAAGVVGICDGRRIRIPTWSGSPMPRLFS